ncbi:MAG: hypothetical protein WAZ50_01450 [Minisyncoccia bacterium]
MISNSILIKDNSYSQGDKSVVDLRQNLLEIDSLFVVAKHAGLVSDLNYEILVGEFKKCIDTVSLPVDMLEDAQNLLLSKDYFGSKMDVSRNNLRLEDIKDKPVHNTFYASSIEKKEDTGLLPSISDIKINKGQNTISEAKHLKEFGAVAVKKNSRQSVIVNLLKRKKEIMIKDVSPLIDGCSEKTIQRELMAMVHSGILHKEGEKRWSRYSLLKAE